jgi:hypothetical protein
VVQLVQRRKGTFLDDAKLHELTFGRVPCSGVKSISKS